ncbi:hypothetical protein HDU97_006780 [Phlyctochytrium planicorne]|nr:hypothetical protein HDU97_006780 [Phlyctochytrium planicorne]
MEGDASSEDRVVNAEGEDDIIPFEDENLDTDELNEESTHPILQVIFDTLFAMVYKNDTLPPAVELCFMVFEDLQFLSYTYQKDFEYDLPVAFKSLIDSLKFVLSSWHTYVGWLVVALVSIWAVFVNVIYTARSIKDSSGAVWPLRTLRLAAAALTTILYIPFLEIFFFGLSCEGDGMMALLPHDVDIRPNCFSAMQAPLSAISILTLIFYIPLVHGLSLVYLEADPSSNHPSARSHGRVECFYLAVRTFVVVANTILHYSTEARLFIQLFGYAVLYTAFARYQPFYNQNLNNMRCGTLAAGVLLSCLGIITFFFKLRSYTNITLPLSFGLILIGFACGFYGSIAYRKITVVKITSRMGEKEEQQKILEGSQTHSGLPASNHEEMQEVARGMSKSPSYAVAMQNPTLGPWFNSLGPTPELKVAEAVLVENQVFANNEINPFTSGESPTAPEFPPEPPIPQEYRFPMVDTVESSKEASESQLSSELSESFSGSSQGQREERHVLFGRFENMEKVFRRWTDSEILAREALEEVRSKVRVMNSDDFMNIYKIFLAAFEDCPNSSGPHIHFVLYLRAFYTESPLVQLHIKRAEELHSAIDLKFFIYVQKRILQQQRQRSNMGSNTEIKVVNLFEHSKYWKLASKYHRLAATQIVGAWRYVLECGGDIRSLPNYARKISDAIERATSAYEVLIARFPNDKTALDSYINFTFDIKNDSKKGQALMQQLKTVHETKTEDQEIHSNTSAKFSSRDVADNIPVIRERRASVVMGQMPQRDLSSLRGDVSAQSASSLARPKGRGMKGGTKGNQNSKGDPVVDLEDEKFKELQQRLTRQFDAVQRKSLKSLMISLWITTSGLVILLCSNLAMMQTVNLIWQSQYVWELNSHSLLFYVNKIYLDCRRQAVSELGLMPLQDPVGDSLRWADTLVYDSEKAADLFNEIYRISDGYSRNAFWNAPTITLKGNKTMSVFTAVNTYIHHGAVMGSLGKSRTYPLTSFANHTSFRFVMDNGIAISAVIKLQAGFDRSYKEQLLSGPSIATSIMLGVSLALQYLLVGNVVIPKLKRFYGQQMRITFIFTKIPKNRIKEIVQKMQAINDSLSSKFENKKTEKKKAAEDGNENAGGGRANASAKKEIGGLISAESDDPAAKSATSKESSNDIAAQVQFQFWVLAGCLTMADILLLFLLLQYFTPEYRSRLTSAMAIWDYRADVVMEHALAFELLLADPLTWPNPAEISMTYAGQFLTSAGEAWIAILKSANSNILGALWDEEPKSTDYIALATWNADMPPVKQKSNSISSALVKNVLPFDTTDARTVPLADELRYSSGLTLYQALCQQVKDRLLVNSTYTGTCTAAPGGIVPFSSYRGVLVEPGVSLSCVNSLSSLITDNIFIYEAFTATPPGFAGLNYPGLQAVDSSLNALIYSGLPRWTRVAVNEFQASLQAASFSYAIINAAAVIIVIVAHILAQRSFLGLMAQTVQVCEMFKMIPAKALESISDLSEFAEDLAKTRKKETTTFFSVVMSWFVQLWNTSKMDQEVAKQEEEDIQRAIDSQIQSKREETISRKNSQVKKPDPNEKADSGSTKSASKRPKRTSTLTSIVKTMPLNEEAEEGLSESQTEEESEREDGDGSSKPVGRVSPFSTVRRSSKESPTTTLDRKPSLKTYKRSSLRVTLAGAQNPFAEAVAAGGAAKENEEEEAEIQPAWVSAPLQQPARARAWSLSRSGGDEGEGPSSSLQPPLRTRAWSLSRAGALLPTMPIESLESDWQMNDLHEEKSGDSMV